MTTTTPAVAVPLYIGNAPPASPSSTTIWRSTSIRDMRVSQDLRDRTVALPPTLTWEGLTIQEPTVFYANGIWHMYYAGGSSGAAGLGYASAPGPQGPWTKAASPVLGQGGAGLAGQAFHASAYVEGSTIYITYADPVLAAFRVATAPVATPTVVTIVGTIFTLPTSSPGGSAACGNTFIFKDDDGTYVLMFEYTVTNNGYQIGFARSSTITSGYTTIGSWALTDLWPGTWPGSPGGTPFTPAGTPGGPMLLKEDDTYVLLFHSNIPIAPAAVVATEAYRATSTDLVDWTVDPAPFVRRVSPREVDQVADICVAQAANGGPWFAWWTAYNNATGAAAIMVAPLQYIDKAWDGFAWAVVGAVSDTSGPRSILQTSNVATTDFTTTTAAGTDVAVTGLSITHNALINERITVTVRMKAKTSVAGELVGKLKVSSGTVYAGFTESRCGYEDMTADKHRTFQMSLTVDVVAGISYVFTAYTQNMQTAGTTTTVANGNTLSVIELKADPN